MTWRSFVLTCVLLSALVVPAASQGDWEEVYLWPGESYTCHDVTLTWKVTNPESKGELSFQGPATKIQNIPFPDKPGYAYLDGVAYYGLHEKGRMLTFRVRNQASRVPLTAAPWKGNRLFISSFNPVFLGSWKLSVSKDPVKYPDGAQYLQLLARDERDGNEVTLPIYPEGFRRFGRFAIQVGPVWLPTRTVVLDVVADADTAVRGADAYVERLGFVRDEVRGHMDTYGEFFERLSAEYGFEVEWVESPEERTDSIEYAKDCTPRATGSSKGILREVLAKMLAYIERSDPNRALAHEWKDPSHLRLWPAHYDKVLAQRKDYEEQQQEREQTKARFEQERQQAKARFENEYSLQTKVFPLKNITPSTAKALVDNVIADYVLVNNEIMTREATERRWGRAPYSIEAEVHEEAYADERSGTLIVTATPKTMEKVGQVLARVDGLLAEGKQAKAIPRRYRVEAVLLQGQGANGGGTELSFAVPGRLVELTASPGTKVEAGEVLARLDPEAQESQLEMASAQLEQNAAVLDAAKKALERARVSVDSRIMPTSHVDEAELALSKAKSELSKAEAQHRQASKVLSFHTLKAPGPGTITSVPVWVHAMVRPGETIAVFKPEAEAAAEKPAAVDIRLAERYGISEEDLEMFELGTLVELGKGAVTLAAERGEAGRAKVSLSEQYACELEFQDVREPYLVVRGRLLDTAGSKTLLENTLYLEKDKPTLLGLTNLREALILVVTLYDAP